MESTGTICAIKYYIEFRFFLMQSSHWREMSLRHRPRNLDQIGAAGTASDSDEAASWYAQITVFLVNFLPSAICHCTRC